VLFSNATNGPSISALKFLAHDKSSVRSTAAKTWTRLVVKNHREPQGMAGISMVRRIPCADGHEKATDNSPAAGNQFVDDFVDGSIRQTPLFS
jgi:hypothetical protein